MKLVLPAVLFFAAAGLAKADTIETISFDLSPLHAGSTLSATFTVPTSLGVNGVTLNVDYAFSDPNDYAEGSVNGPRGGTLPGTVSIFSNAPISNYDVEFYVPEFYNPGGNQFDTANTLTAHGFAQCASFPCTSTGNFTDGQAFSRTYTVTPAAATPEPSSFLLLATGLAGAGFLYTKREALA